MNAFEERSRSLWMDIEVAVTSPLKESITADTVVIGAGISGLSIAYELTRLGQKVAVVDRGRIAGGMSARTSAHLTPQCDDGFKALIQRRGEDGARIFYESHAAAVDRIEQIQEEEKISCRFRRVNGYLFPAVGKEPAEELTPELEATRQIGMPIERHTGLPFKDMDQARCLRYPNLATFHPLQYLKGVASALEARGGFLFSETTVTEIKEADSAVVVHTTSGAKIEAGHAIVATNSPINDRVALHSKMAPYRTYVMAITIPRDSIEDALFWDTLDPYHYVRLEAGRGNTQYLLVGGADHKTGEADDGWARFEGLESWARGLLPRLGNVTHRWSGQVLDTVDYASFTGRNPGNERVFVHTGDSGQGLTHGVMASLLLSALVTGKANTWAEFYAPERVRMSAAGTYVAENVTAVKNFAEYVAPGELKSVDELKPGQGAVIREGLRKVAAFRDDSGAVHRLSAACTHLGCHLHWNSLEQCWDCPCHGSHFGTDGTPLNGPAVSPLQKLE
jgi:glycine/D-amino acid oxidase-like deaminating enzyme/nitrite reductase/ring-hydroxylating ferredoxin subunit